MKILLCVEVNEDGFVALEPMYLLKGEETLRDHIRIHMFDQPVWFDVHTANTVKIMTSECYEPTGCLPGACRFCEKFPRLNFANYVISSITAPYRNYQYVFFEMGELSTINTTPVDITK
jgi:hypothetical protein